MKKNSILVLVILFSALFLNGCFPGSSMYSAQQPAGFFSGVWHGWIAPVSLVVGFFNPAVRIYEANNTGWWYDFGFYIAIIAGFGGFALSRNRNKKQ